MKSQIMTEWGDELRKLFNYYLKKKHKYLRKINESNTKLKVNIIPSTIFSKKYNNRIHKEETRIVKNSLQTRIVTWIFFLYK